MNIRTKLLLVSLLLPAISFAALNGLHDLLTSIGTIMNDLIPLIFGLCLIYFFWGLSQFILHAGGKDHEAGKSKMLWGIIALFVFISIFGILRFIGNVIGIPVESGTPGQDIQNINPYQLQENQNG